MLGHPVLPWRLELGCGPFFLTWWLGKETSHPSPHRAAPSLSWGGWAAEQKWSWSLWTRASLGQTSLPPPLPAPGLWGHQHTAFRSSVWGRPQAGNCPKLPCTLETLGADSPGLSVLCGHLLRHQWVLGHFTYIWNLKSRQQTKHRTHRKRDQLCG